MNLISPSLTEDELCLKTQPENLLLLQQSLARSRISLYVYNLITTGSIEYEFSYSITRIPIALFVHVGRRLTISFVR